MAYVGNSPQANTILRVEARKSFALSLWFQDTNRRPADLNGCTVRLVVKKMPLDPADTTDADNLIDSSVAEFVAPELGYCRFDVQAVELDIAPGEYPYAIVLLTPQGYSAVVVKGSLDVVQNTEVASIGQTYTDIVGSTSALEIHMRTLASIDVICGPLVPPGFTWMSDADKEKIDGLSLAGNLLPDGGLVNQMLAKATGADYDFKWVNPQSFDGTLDAAGQPANYAPVANGDGTWDWAEVSGVVDWNATPGTPGSIENKPDFGTAALEDSTAFAAADHTHDGDVIVSGEVNEAHLPRVIELRGIESGTADPTGGVAGDLYLKFTP